MLLASLGTSIANVGLPAMGRHFDASFQQVQWIVLAYLLAITACIVTTGRIGDVTGRRRLLLAGIALFSSAALLCGLAPSLWALVTARAVQGIGAAIMMALTMAFVGETVPRERMGRAMGLLGTTSAIGTALGPSLGGALIAAFSWRAIFLVSVPLGALALALAHRHLPADQLAADRPRTAFDVAGTSVLATTLVAYALAMTLGRGSFGASNVVLLAAAVLGGWLFVHVEGRAAAPVIRLAMLRERGLGSGLVMSSIVSTVMMATLVVGPFYLARSLGLGAAGVGLAMSAGPVVAALTGVPAGRLVDRLGHLRTTVGGLAVTACGCSALCGLPTRSGVPGYIAPMVAITAGYALFQAANNTGVMAGVVADQRGVVSGMLNLSRNLGLVTGASAMGAVFALASASSDVGRADPGSVATGMRVTFGVAAALVAVALGVAVSNLRGEPRAERAL